MYGSYLLSSSLRSKRPAWMLYSVVFHPRKTSFRSCRESERVSDRRSMVSGFFLPIPGLAHKCVSFALFSFPAVSSFCLRIRSRSQTFINPLYQMAQEVARIMKPTGNFISFSCATPPPLPTQRLLVCSSGTVRLESHPILLYCSCSQTVRRLLDFCT